MADVLVLSTNQEVEVEYRPAPEVEYQEPALQVVEVEHQPAPEVEYPAYMNTTAEVVPVIGPRGPAGRDGVDGAPGVTGTTFTYRQSSPSASWVVHHDLGYNREPTLLLDSAPTVPVWADVIHQDVNTSIIMLPEPATGWAYF